MDRNFIIATLLPIFFTSLAACAHSVEDGLDSLPELATKPVNSGSGVNCALELAKEKLCAVLLWETEPTGTSKGRFILKFTDLNGAPTTPAQTVNVKLWMPSMGHGSSPVSIAQVDSNTFRASDVFFVMAGSWEIHIQLKTGSTVNDEAIQLYEAHD